MTSPAPSRLSSFLQSPTVGGWGFGVGLLLLTILGLRLRTTTLDDSLWLDELVTAWTVEGSLGEMLKRAAAGHMSPLYFLLPWASRVLFGFTEVALRLPSVVAGVVTIPLAGWLTGRWAKSAIAGLLVAALVAIDENLLFFSQEARVYAVLQLVALAQVGCLERLLHTERHRWFAATAVLSVLMFYLHYTAVLLLAAEAVCLLAMVLMRWLPIRWKVDYLLSRWLSWGALIAVLLLPGLVQLLATGGNRDAWWLFIDRPSPAELVTMFAWGAYCMFPIAMVALLGLVASCSARLMLLRHSTTIATWWLVVCWMTLPVVTAWVVTYDALAPLWLRRFLISSAVAPMVLAGLCCGTLKLRWLRAMAAIVCLTVVVFQLGPPQWLDPRVDVARHSDEDWKSAVALINANDTRRDWPVLVRSGLIEADELPQNSDPMLRALCLLPVTSLYAIDGDEARLFPLRTTRPGVIRRATVARLTSADGIWVIGRGAWMDEFVAEEVQKNLTEAGMPTQKSAVYRYGSTWVFVLPRK